MQIGKPSTLGVRGFTYVAILFFLAASSAVLAVTANIWSQQRQREKERELLWIGEEFRQAFEQYYRRSPGVIPEYPKNLEELLEDRRQLAKARYLRRIYRDPMTGEFNWGLVAAPGGRIMGVYSLSTEQPLKRNGFALESAEFYKARQYSDWKFIFVPQADPRKSPPLK